MSNHSTPIDTKKFILIAFVAFAVVFVFAMLMMLWHGNVEYSSTGERHYQTEVKEP